MTAQQPEELINEHPRVNFSGQQLYAVTRGHPSQNDGWGERFRFPTPPRPPADVSPRTSNWRGYVAEFRLAADGSLELVRFRFRRKLRGEDFQDVHDTLDGDFWLVFRPGFGGPRTFVPFRDGLIVEDTSEWIVDTPRDGSVSG